MPAGSASMGGRLHELYTQAEAARKRSEFLAGQLRATQSKANETWQVARASRDETVRLRAWRLAARTDPGRLRYSAYARLQARLVSMPVIEQAKGIIMARYGWPEEEAFTALRRVSQRENIKVRDLAASIVARASHPAPAQRHAGRTVTVAQPDGEVVPQGGLGRSRDRDRAPA